MKKCVITCYFGSLPNYFELYLQSCRRNEDIDWIIITDNKIAMDAENIIIWNYSFEEFSKRIQSSFNFPINLKTEYKWCDYKPAVGYIFADQIIKYDYWGFGDLDLIWGKLNRFYPDSIIGKYEKFLLNGHLQFYKNTKKMREIFMRPINRVVDYRTVFQSGLNFGFDEEGRISITQIIKHENIRVFKDKNHILDIMPFGERFFSVNEAERELKYVRAGSEGVFGVFEGYEKEYAYVHFQKRKFVLADDLDPSEEVFVRYNDMSNKLSDIDNNNPKIIKKSLSKYSILKNRVQRTLAIANNMRIIKEKI